jgi:hypothetical protein
VDGPHDYPVATAYRPSVMSPDKFVALADQKVQGE